MGADSNVTGYRFKTKEELIEEYGEEDWSSRAGFNPQGNMDYLLGTSVKIPDFMFDHEGNLFQNKKFRIQNTGPANNTGFREWAINPKMLVKVSHSNSKLSVFAGGTSSEYDQRLLLLLR